MFSKTLLSAVLTVSLMVSSVYSLQCVQCTHNMANDNLASPNACATRTTAPGVECNNGNVCSRLLNKKTNLLSRECSEKDICSNLDKDDYECQTCTTDYCNSAISLKTFYAPLIASIFFLIFELC